MDLWRKRFPFLCPNLLRGSSNLTSTHGTSRSSSRFEFMGEALSALDRGWHVDHPSAYAGDDLGTSFSAEGHKTEVFDGYECHGFADDAVP